MVSFEGSDLQKAESENAPDGNSLSGGTRKGSRKAPRLIVLFILACFLEFWLVFLWFPMVSDGAGFV